MSAGKLNVNTNASTANEAEIEDRFCLPQKPQQITFEDVQRASAVIKKCIEPTPCEVTNLNERSLSIENSSKINY